MNMIKKIVFLGITLFASMHVPADVNCSGKITEVVVWSSSNELSILLEGTNRYIKLTETSAITAAMTAFAAQKTTYIYFNNDNINQCHEGWPHYTLLQGYIRVKD